MFFFRGYDAIFAEVQCALFIKHLSEPESPGAHFLFPGEQRNPGGPKSEAENFRVRSYKLLDYSMFQNGSVVTYIYQ
jgi:hypothetical protein